MAEQPATPEQPAAPASKKKEGPAGSPSPWQRRLKRGFSFFFAAFLVICVLTGFSLLYLRSQALPVTKVLQTSQIFDVNGELIETLDSGQNRKIVPINEISVYVVKATLAIEDQNFYNHPGFDVKSIARAAVVNLKNMSKVQGAGTITQQLARNLYLNHDRTWTRKIKETVYAVQMEMQLDKDQILESYLNQIYYGHSTYGIEAASQLFFGKHAKDLTLAESALLVGVPKGPKYYSPYYNMENALDRKNVVLKTMVNEGFVTQQEADAAAAQKLDIKPLAEKKPSPAPYFRDYIKNQAIQKLGITEEQFEQGGHNIYTTLDLQAQKIAEQQVSKHIPKDSELQGALISIDPRNGYIKAMVGGKNYEANQFNRVFATSRQPGSSFKPFVYLTALQNGFTPLSKVRSEPRTFTYDDGRKTYTPRNFNDQYENADIDMRRAIAKSDNIYAVDTILKVGPQQVVDTARRFGINGDLQPLPSLALGTYPASPFEMVSAFAALANQGVRVEPTAIIKIEDMAGLQLYKAEPKSERVADAAPSYVLTHMMESVFETGGTASRVAATIKRPVAGKTGTTDADAWMVGYTPELATAVWVGYDKGRAINTAESHLASPIFAGYTEGALEAIPPKLFPVPEGVTTVYIDPVSGKLANEDCSTEARVEAFLTGTEPKEYCTNRSSRDKGFGSGARSWWNDVKRWWND
ncbi:transglycosylase domain-containing protein [Paenibacillus lutrae]|uniref:PBP1A family penicillin-binding protein n=1 Tax=Paenibacillus lutrae TaxID=2078573 RepID=A0A7X3FNZ2_9BACL|nr:PBP1A family penicillin-binding protein [Paenibacillus lutrae]MVP02537.1 PBP1A family penicillin-binding protein [Paenibacillus lutrae]